MNNPFHYGRVVKGDAFCPRPILQKRLEGYIRAAQNVSIQGERRMGKTSLALAASRGVKGCRVLHADLLGIRTAGDFCKRVVAAASRLDAGDSFFRKTIKAISGLRPTFKIDAMTGEPVVSIDAKAADPATSIDAVFDMLDGYSREMKLCVVLDEFQDILDMEESESLVAQIRGRIQMMDKPCFLFLGSVRNRMYELFTSPGSPFFKSALLFEVGPMPDGEFTAFLRQKFEYGGREITDDALDAVLSCAERTPGDVQQLCHALWETTDRGSRIGRDSISEALRFIFEQEGAFYVRQVKLLTAFQERVLAAVAEAGIVGTLTSAFMEAVGSASRTSVKKALARLNQLEILFLRDGEFHFVNPFFRRWMMAR